MPRRTGGGSKGGGDPDPPRRVPDDLARCRMSLGMAIVRNGQLERQIEELEMSASRIVTLTNTQGVTAKFYMVEVTTNPVFCTVTTRDGSARARVTAFFYPLEGKVLGQDDANRFDMNAHFHAVLDKPIFYGEPSMMLPVNGSQVTTVDWEDTLTPFSGERQD